MRRKKSIAELRREIDSLKRHNAAEEERERLEREHRELRMASHRSFFRGGVRNFKGNMKKIGGFIEREGRAAKKNPIRGHIEGLYNNWYGK